MSQNLFVKNYSRNYLAHSTKKCCIFFRGFSRPCVPTLQFERWSDSETFNWIDERKNRLCWIWGLLFDFVSHKNGMYNIHSRFSPASSSHSFKYSLQLIPVLSLLVIASFHKRYRLMNEDFHDIEKKILLKRLWLQLLSSF